MIDLLTRTFVEDTIHFSANKFADLDTNNFDTAAYSRLKFGDDAVAKKFGYEMAVKFMRQNPTFFHNPVLIIAAPSSATVPAASTLLAHHMMNRCNMVMSEMGLPLVGWTPIHRITTYYDNYAHLPKEDRVRLLSQDKIFINRGFIEGKSLIFVDDCNITGTHELKIEQYLQNEGIDNTRAYACYAKYTGEDASIEGRLNHVDVHDARDLIRVVNQGNYILTTRAARMILEHPLNELPDLLNMFEDSFVESVYHASIMKEYHLHPSYSAAFAIVKKAAFS